MRIAGVYSFNGGKEFVADRYPHLLTEVNAVIKNVDAVLYKDKVSAEKTMPGRMLYSPSRINAAFKAEFGQLGWRSIRVRCDYPTTYYLEDYEIRSKNRGAFREMDFVKEKLGIEVQFGKYAFMVYNVCAKMTIFRNLGYIDGGIEIVPVKAFADDMSTGVSYFEQFVWDLESRGVADIDIPVLILGIDDTQITTATATETNTLPSNIN
ncbi:MAG TPA: BglII/BstYI family type II restriction endonuclease [Pyrinomonadaceae bacterium]